MNLHLQASGNSVEFLPKVSQARNKKTAVVQADQESSNNVCTTNQPNPKGEEEGARANFYMIAICPKKVGQFHPLFFCFEGEDLFGKIKISNATLSWARKAFSAIFCFLLSFVCYSKLQNLTNGKRQLVCIRTIKHN